MTDCNLHFIITMQVYLCSKAIHQYNKMYLKKYVTKSKRIVLHPNFGLVNEGVRPLLFTKPGISLNPDSVL